MPLSGLFAVFNPWYRSTAKFAIHARISADCGDARHEEQPSMCRSTSCQRSCLAHPAPGTRCGVRGPASDVKLPAFDYLDLAATWKVFDEVTLRGGVSNITDRDPPLVGRSSLPFRLGSGNTFPTVYDPLGRYLFFGLTVDF